MEFSGPYVVGLLAAAAILVAATLASMSRKCLFRTSK